MATEEEKAKRAVIQAAKELAKKGLTARTWGNISARISDTQFVITPSGLSYDTLTEDKIVTVDIRDVSYEGDVKPSSEAGIHADVYKLRPSVGAVIHTHQKAASAISVCPEGLLIESEKEKALLGNIAPCTAYGMPGTKKLRKAVRKTVSDDPESRGFLLPRHGALLVGSDLKTVFSEAEALECAAEKKYHSIVRESGLARKRPPELTKALYIRIRRGCGAVHLIYAGGAATLCFSKKGEKLLPWLDDLSQIAGVNICCCDISDVKSMVRELRHKNAVLIKGYGALCTGNTREDALAVKMILEKGCMAALYGEKTADARPLNPIDARLQRFVYRYHYSKMS